MKIIRVKNLSNHSRVVSNVKLDKGQSVVIGEYSDENLIRVRALQKSGFQVIIEDAVETPHNPSSFKITLVQEEPKKEVKATETKPEKKEVKDTKESKEEKSEKVEVKKEVKTESKETTKKETSTKTASKSETTKKSEAK